MLLARHPALNQLIGVMLGLALAVGDMANAWQEQHLPTLHVAAVWILPRAQRCGLSRASAAK